MITLLTKMAFFGFLKNVTLSYLLNQDDLSANVDLRGQHDLMDHHDHMDHQDIMHQHDLKDQHDLMNHSFFCHRLSKKI